VGADEENACGDGFVGFDNELQRVEVNVTDEDKWFGDVEGVGEGEDEGGE